MGGKYLILLDTHVLIWLDEGNPELGARSKEMIDKALQQDHLAVSAISFWKIAMLVQKGRIEMALGIARWREELFICGLREILISGQIGIQAAHLSDFHGDPADRLITATAQNIPQS